MHSNRTLFIAITLALILLAIGIGLSWTSVPQYRAMRFLPRYAIADEYNEEMALNSFLDDPNSIERAGCFYDGVNNSDNLNLISIHDQSILMPVGHDLTIQNTFYGQLINQYIEFDDFNFSYKNVKSVQINKQAWEYYNLSDYTQASISWESVNYNKDVPILLGSTYESIIPIGTKIQIDNYIHPISAEVVGYLKSNTRIFFNDNLRYSLDDHVVIPYPPQATIDKFRTVDEFGKIVLNMITTEVVPSKGPLALSHVDHYLKEVATKCSFKDYISLDDYSLRREQYLNIRWSFMIWNTASMMSCIVLTLIWMPSVMLNIRRLIQSTKPLK